MLNFPQDSHPNNLDIRSFADHVDQHLNLVPADASSYFPFPPTIFFPDGLHDLLVFPHSSSPDVIVNNTTAAVVTTAPPAQPDLLIPHGDRGAAMAAAAIETSCARARVSRKDRHSKIYTASGPRDRRMRLSIDVARRFFQLQDMLGFDKASKTVQWLLSMSKAAIKDLAAASSSSIKHCCTSSSNPSPNSTESSAISGSKNKQHSASTVTASEAGGVRKLTTTTKAKKGSTNYNKPSRNKAENYFHSTLARESRAKARERARERTKEKQRLTSLTSSNSIPFDHDIKQESTAFGDLKSVLELGDERANCDYPSIGASELFPVYGNSSSQQGAVGDHAGGGIYQEQWDLEAVSFYPGFLPP